MRAGSPRLDIGIELDWQHDEHLLSMAFPLDLRTDTAACDIQFGHVRRPTHPSTSWDAAKFEVCAHRYVDVSEPDFGVAVLNDGRYGHGLFDGRVRVSLARAAALPRSERGPRNARREPGAVPARSRAGRRARRGAALHDAAARRPRPRARSAPTPIVAVTGRGVEIDAIKLADDDPKDLIVRLHEAVGNRTRITVRCDRPVSAASMCNLLEEPHAGLEVGDGICALTVRPFEIVTLRLDVRGYSVSSASPQMSQRDPRVDRDAVDHRVLVEHHEVRVVGGGRARVAIVVGSSEEQHRAGHSLQHVREVLGAHDRIGHAVHVPVADHLTCHVEREVGELVVVARDRIAEIDLGRSAVASCASAMRSATRRRLSCTSARVRSLTARIVPMISPSRG